MTKATSLDGRKYNIACGQIDIGNAATEMTARMGQGVPQANGSIEVEPTFVINYLKRNFGHFRRRLDEAMEPIFAIWDTDLGGEVDRRLIVDLLVRYALSEMLVPAGPEEDGYPARIGAMINLLRRGTGAA